MAAVRLMFVLFLAACAASVDRGPGGDSRSEAPLHYRLSARDSYAAGAPVAIGFTLENRSSEPLWVLTWYTPLEGLAGKIFRVTRDGVEVPYHGMMAKRGNPAREDYVRLEAGGTAEAEVDLSSGYDLAVPGAYRVEFDGRIFDVVRAEAQVPRESRSHQGMDIPGEDVSFRVVRP